MFREWNQRQIVLNNVTPWIQSPSPRLHAHWRLFCFPYAGGSARVYRDWGDRLPAQVEVCPVELPGRGRRITAPLFTSLDELLPHLGEALVPWLDKPFACFGHSLGGVIAFEWVRWLRQNRQPQPAHLWISAVRAPHLVANTPPIHDLPRAEFLAELRRYNGTPAEILENAELMDLMLPTLRADFALLETYGYWPQPPLTCSITALWGERDAIVKPEEMAPWQQHTVGTFSLEAVSGDHFFIHQPHVLRSVQLYFSQQIFA
ncbi:MAG: alpha/beta fold hydrolase [Synechococcales bacterium]|nr:alpha/beta fold hydrolase [Synechococcales bacterium]